MRLYLKLILTLVITVTVTREWFRQVIAEVGYDVRVAWVWARGSPGELDRLVDDTQRMLATQRGELELYLWGKRCRELIEQRLAQAAAENASLSDEQLQLLRVQCALESLSEPTRLPIDRAAAQRMAEFEAQLLRDLRENPAVSNASIAPAHAGSGSDARDSS